MIFEYNSFSSIVGSILSRKALSSLSKGCRTKMIFLFSENCSKIEVKFDESSR